MPTAEFFRKLGLFAVREFFSREFRESVCNEVHSAQKNPKLWREAAFDVYGETEPRFNKNVRRTRFLQLSPAIIAEARRKLIKLMPQVSDHFNIELKDCQELKVAVYRTGDFFKHHADTTDFQDARQELKERKVSVVIFLNEETTEFQKKDYSGGNLTFYGLMHDSVFDNYGLPLIGEAGLLIAFPSHLVHEVTPVTSGERYVIVTWYI